MNRKNEIGFFLLAVLLIISACAKVSTPSGGVRDRMPPVVVKSKPVDGQTNFRGQRISITFNEYVTLDNINDKFMVSPPMKQKPRVYTRGKDVRVDYTDKLRDSTTYTFYFMDAIRDLNEGNILNNYKVAFSTGPVIDSLSVTGNVFTALNLEFPESTTVLLYSNTDDTAVVKTIPDYISRVDPQGYFRIDNLRPGKYRLFALKDDDNSKNYNRVEEAIAFLDTLISITPENNFLPPEVDTVKPVDLTKRAPAKKAPVKTFKPRTDEKEEVEIPLKTGQYQLILFNGPKTARYLANSSRPEAYHLTYMLSVPADTMHFTFRIDSVPEDKYFIERSRNRDTLNVWITDSTVYSKTSLSTIVNYPFTDSLKVDGYKQDTIKMLFIPPRATRGVKKKPSLEITNSISGGNLKPGRKILFTSPTPLKDPDTSKIRLYEIVEKKRVKMPYMFIRDSLLSERLILDSKYTEGKQYLLITDSAAFSNIYNVVSDSVGIVFTMKEKDAYSSLILSITNCGNNCLVQLLDNTEKLLSWGKPDNTGKLVFSLLDKGTYRLRAIDDINGDGKWTTGDYFKKRQPEPVTYFKEIEIPEGWQDNENWDIRQWNYKSQRLRQQPKQR